MNANPKRCTGCGEEVESVLTPEGRRQCPRCGAPAADPVTRSRINWFVFLMVLLAPTLFTVLGAKTKSDGLAIGSALFGSLAAGIICGVWTGLRFGQTTGWRFALGIVFTFVFGVVSLVLACFGCSLGGFNLNIH